MTNADKIRSMTDEQLAELLNDYDAWTEKSNLDHYETFKIWLAWLREEALHFYVEEAEDG